MKYLFLSLCIVVFAFSCSNSDDSEETQLPESNFYALTAGNSWVYKHYWLDIATNQLVFNGTIDSISIVSSEDIFGDTYYKMRTLHTQLNSSPEETFQFLREYQGSLITDSSEVEFVNNDNSEIVEIDAGDTYIYHKLDEDVETITVEGGVFECFGFGNYWNTSSTTEEQLVRRKYYANGVGKVLHRYYASSVDNNDAPNGTIYREIRLDSYNVQ